MCGAAIEPYGNHEYDNTKGDGLCKYCSAPHKHTEWKDSEGGTGKVCADCGYVCPHVEFDREPDGCYIYYNCALCGYQKTEDAHD